MPDDTTTSAPVTEGTGQTPAAQSGKPGGQSPAPTPAPKTFTQDEVNALISQRLSEAQERARKEQERAETARKTKEAEEQGEYKTLAEQLKAEAAQLKADLEAERRAALISREAAAVNLPTHLHKYVIGTDEATIKASAAELAAAVRPPPAPNTGAGAGTRPQPTPTAPAPSGAAPAYTIPAGYIPLPD